MKPVPFILALCVGLSNVLQTKARLELNMKSTEDNQYDLLTCSDEANDSDDKILSMIDITIIDITHPRNKLKLASASILEKDLSVQHSRNIEMKVSGEVSKDRAELDIWFKKESQFGLGSYLCELTFIDKAGHTDKSHAAVKAKLPYEFGDLFSFNSEVTLTEQLDRMTNLLADAMRHMNNTVDQLTAAKSHMRSTMDETLVQINGNFTALETALTKWAQVNQNQNQKTVDQLNAVKKSQMINTLDERLAQLEDRFTALQTSLINQMTTLLDKYPQVKDDANEQYFDVMGTGKNEWRLAFRGKARIGKPVFEGYITAGVNVEPGCRQPNATAPCQNHYRNDDVLDKWQNIEEVAFVLYEGGVKVKQIIFDAAGTTSMNWFQKDKVKSSSWDDLTPSATTNFFGINAHPRRKFFINSYYAGCAKDVGWFVASDTTISCPWDSTDIIPAFLYSNAPTMQTWEGGDIKAADIMAVFVKYYAI